MPNVTAPTPITIARAVSPRDVARDILGRIDRRVADAAETIRRVLADDYQDGLGSEWGSYREYGDLLYPELRRDASDGELDRAAEGRVNRLINYEFRSASGPTLEDICRAAMARGLDTDSLVRRVLPMREKRSVAVSVWLPQYASRFAATMGYPPPDYSVALDESSRDGFNAALDMIGLPDPELFETHDGFESAVEGVTTRTTATRLQAYWATVFAIGRPMLFGFEGRLLMAARRAKRLGDPRGEQLLGILRVCRTILSATTRVIARVPAGAPDRLLLEKAARRLTKLRLHRHRLTPDHLADLLRQFGTSVSAIRGGDVTVGWMVWHDPMGRHLADELLRSDT